MLPPRFPHLFQHGINSEWVITGGRAFHFSSSRLWSMPHASFCTTVVACKDDKPGLIGFEYVPAFAKIHQRSLHIDGRPTSGALAQHGDYIAVAKRSQKTGDQGPAGRWRWKSKIGTGENWTLENLIKKEHRN